MKVDERTALRELAFIVCTTLAEADTTVVLSGGGAATIWAPDAIQSFDLDFVVTLHAKEDGAATRALAALGFERRGQEYRHATCRFHLDFPRGPLAIGGDLVDSWTTLHEKRRHLNVISATDSCRDRLAAFYHFGDRSAAAQARAVWAANRRRVDLAAIETWSRREGMAKRHAEFVASLA